MQSRPKLGQILLDAGMIDEHQLQTALGEQTRWGGHLGLTLVKLDFLSEADLVRTLGHQLSLPTVRLDGKRIAPEVLGLVGGELAEQRGCLPLFTTVEGGVKVLYLGMEDPGDLAVTDDLSFRLGMKVRPAIVGPIQLRAAIAAFYGDKPGGAPSPAAAPSGLDEVPVSEGDTAPLVELGPASVEEQSELPLPEPPPKPRDVPTRDILRALTHLLIEKGLIGREELLTAVHQVANGEDPSLGGS